MFEGCGLRRKNVCVWGFWIANEELQFCVCLAKEAEVRRFRFVKRVFQLGHFRWGDLKGEGSITEVRCDFEGFRVLDWDCNLDWCMFFCSFAWDLFVWLFCFWFGFQILAFIVVFFRLFGVMVFEFWNLNCLDFIVECFVLCDFGTDFGSGVVWSWSIWVWLKIVVNVFDKIIQW